MRAVIATVSVLVVTGCADDSARSAPESIRGGTITAVDPVDGAPLRFTVEDLPEGWEISNVEDGYAEPTWSSDSFGGTHPSVVLVPEDWRGIDDARWVIIESYDGSDNQGGVTQELPGYPEEPQPNGSIRGQAAIWNDATTHESATFVAVDTSGADKSRFGSGPTGYIVRGAAFHSAEDLKLFASAVTEAPVHEPVTIDAPAGWTILASLSGSQTARDRWDALEGTRQVEVVATTSGEPGGLTLTTFLGDANTATAIAIQRFSRAYQSPSRPRLVKRAGVEWYADPVFNDYIVSTFGGRPVTLDRLPRGVDDAFIAQVLASLREVDEREWSAEIERTMAKTTESESDGVSGAVTSPAIPSTTEAG